MSKFALVSGESFTQLEQPVMSRTAALALAGGLAVSAGLLGVTSSSSLEGYCAQREQLAPGGHASPAPACEFNESVRTRVKSIVDMPNFGNINLSIDPNDFKLFSHDR